MVEFKQKIHSQLSIAITNPALGVLSALCDKVGEGGGGKREVVLHTFNIDSFLPPPIRMIFSYFGFEAVSAKRRKNSEAHFL